MPGSADKAKSEIDHSHELCERRMAMIEADNANTDALYDEEGQVDEEFAASLTTSMGDQPVPADDEDRDAADASTAQKMAALAAQLVEEVDKKVSISNSFLLGRRVRTWELGLLITRTPPISSSTSDTLGDVESCPLGGSALRLLSGDCAETCRERNRYSRLRVSTLTIQTGQRQNVPMVWVGRYKASHCAGWHLR